ncbi:unnamed protein product [Peronospora destructor]|uniref:Mediator of RNA polymerase II transcription subunit 13 n=1 Tax=Peronospora destructor TaxID=86335 RepID=A0AAV0UMV3_9STRA|nr:unnamed protein product [Peronospora destructor]
MERRASVSPLMTNTFTLCDLMSLEWHVYSHSVPIDKAGPSKKKTIKKAVKAGALQTEGAALTGFFQRLQQRNAVCVIEDTRKDITSSSLSFSSSRELWVFIVNGMQNGVPVEPSTGVRETQTGSWTAATTPLDTAVQKQFFAALSSVLSRKLLAQDEFMLTDEGFYGPNDASFIFCCPSLTRLNHVEVYLEEEFPIPAFQLYFKLFELSNILTVAVDVVRKEDSLASDGAIGMEVGDMRCSWERLVGLPTQKDHSMVDVWHVKDDLVPRMIAETKYMDVTPWFRTISKRTHKRRLEDDEGSGNEEEVKKDENEEDADEDDDDNNQEADVEADELIRRAVTGGAAKAKRKRDSADLTENDESLAPTSPDMHVNTPNAAGPILQMTLPHDDDLRLRVDSEPVSALASKGTALDPAQLYSMAKASLSKSGPAFTMLKNDAKPLSVAVSLVESLSHNEQHEVLDGRPMKTHPLLQALQDYVDDEAKLNIKAKLTSVVSSKAKFLPNAETYIPPPLRSTVGRLSINRATADRLRLHLCSDRFKCWRPEYTRLQYPKNGRQQKKEQQRRLLLEFDEVAFEKRAQQEAVLNWNRFNQLDVRNDEISLGIQMAASDALVTWRQGPEEWSAHSNLREDKNEIEVRKTKCDRRWMSLEEYAQALMRRRGNKRLECVRVEEVPKFCVSTLEASYHVEPAIISEYLLRDLYPVAAPKPVDYVIVCPQSPTQWFASLALSYFSCFRSMYAQCHMGDLARIDLGQVEGNHYLLSGATKKTEAFSRSAVANVVYLMVPFRRSDVKHKMWTLGAFSSGLFGTENITEVSGWKDSVTIEMVYLEDLYEVMVNPSPLMLMPNCFGLYDRVCENLNLKPADGVVTCAGRSRFLCERLYHLADWRAGKLAENQQVQMEPPYIYGGYLLSEDRKWIACSCTDAVGSVLETCMIPVEDGSGLENALLKMMLKMLQFLALFGEKSVLVVTRLTSTSGATCLNNEEKAAWETLRSNRLEELIPMAFIPLLSCVLLLQLNAASNKEVQLRENPSSTALYVSDNLGFAVMSPQESAAARANSRAVLCTGSDAWKSTSLLQAQHTLTHKQEARVLKVTLVLALLKKKDNDCKNGKVTKSAPPSMMTAILRDFYAQSYLTMHPITLERQSPLPHHLAAILKMSRELQVLETQLTTDPLQTR